MTTFISCWTGKTSRAAAVAAAVGQTFLIDLVTDSPRDFSDCNVSFNWETYSSMPWVAEGRVPHPVLCLDSLSISSLQNPTEVCLIQSGIWRQDSGSCHPTDKKIYIHTQEGHFSWVLSYESERAVLVLKCGCRGRAGIERERCAAFLFLYSCSVSAYLE